MLFIVWLAMPVLGAEVAEELIIDCGGSPCSIANIEPGTAFDRPTCTEYAFDGAVIEALRRGDQSARELLQQRHDTTFTHAERLRIASALLRHVDDDRAYWNEIYKHAENVVRLAEQGLDPGEHASLSYGALELAGTDQRGHELLLRALQSKDFVVVVTAIIGFGQLHDDAALPAIETAIQRFDPRERLAFVLYEFHSAAADDVAKRYLSADDFENYKQARDEPLQ
jgi:HEAT repeat protein